MSDGHPGFSKQVAAHYSRLCAHTVRWISLRTTHGNIIYKIPENQIQIVWRHCPHLLVPQVEVNTLTTALLELETGSRLGNSRLDSAIQLTVGMGGKCDDTQRRLFENK